MDEIEEQKVCLNLCASNDISPEKSFKMLQKAFGDSALSEKEVNEWFERRKITSDLAPSTAEENGDDEKEEKSTKSSDN